MGGVKTNIRLRLYVFQVDSYQMNSGRRQLRLQVLARRSTGYNFIQSDLRGHETPEEGAQRMLEENGMSGLVFQVRVTGTVARGIMIHCIALHDSVQGPEQLAQNLFWKDVYPRRQSELSKSMKVVVQRLISEVEHGTAGFFLVNHKSFTVSDIRRVRMAVMGIHRDPSNFRKRVTRWVELGVLEDLKKKRASSTRPAQLYAYDPS